MWKSLAVIPHELRLCTTLKCGQSFRWIAFQTSETTTYSCALNGRLISLQQTPTEIRFRAIFAKGSEPENEEYDDTAQLLHTYFQLDVDIADLYRQWSQADPNFEKKAVKFAGIRILAQDPLESLVSFICSSNNHIPRITQMVEKFCRTYGTYITALDGNDYYDFPTLKQLASHLHPSSTLCIEPTLRQLGFGYRAKYIHETIATLVEDKPTDWLYSLRNMSYKEAKSQLLSLMGVGPKVADCVLLMSCYKPGAIPIDTHVWKIATRDYNVAKSGNKLNKDIYDKIGEKFRDLFGPYAGWAHSVLFTADLRSFNHPNSDENNVDDNYSVSNVPLKVFSAENNNTSIATIPFKVGKRSSSNLTSTKTKRVRR